MSVRVPFLDLQFSNDFQSQESEQKSHAERRDAQIAFDDRLEELRHDARKLQSKQRDKHAAVDPDSQAALVSHQADHLAVYKFPM